MVWQRHPAGERKKSAARTTRDISVALYLLRCKEMRLTLEELDQLDSGMVWDMMAERSNDRVRYPVRAGQKEFSEFAGG